MSSTFKHPQKKVQGPRDSAAIIKRLPAVDGINGVKTMSTFRMRKITVKNSWRPKKFRPNLRVFAPKKRDLTLMIVGGMVKFDLFFGGQKNPWGEKN